MKNFLDKLLVPFLAIGAALGALFWFVRTFFGGNPVKLDEFPQKQKDELKKEIKTLEKEESAIEKKKYSDEELNDIFNGEDEGTKQ